MIILYLHMHAVSCKEFQKVLTSFIDVATSPYSVVCIRITFNITTFCDPEGFIFAAIRFLVMYTGMETKVIPELINRTTLCYLLSLLSSKLLDLFFSLSFETNLLKATSGL